MTLDAAAPYIGKTARTLMRIEGGETGIAERDLAMLLGLYRVDEDMARTIFALYEAPSTQSTWTASSPSGSLVLVVGLESVPGATIKAFNHRVLPGFLQTREYATAVMQALTPNPDSEAIARQADEREMRFSALFGEKAPTVTTIVDEVVVRRKVGGPAVMGAQLERLLELPANVELRVVPDSVGLHPGHLTFAVFEFGSGLLEPVAYVEGVADGQIIMDDEKEIENFRSTFGRIAEVALSAEESAELLRQIAFEGKGQ